MSDQLPIIEYMNEQLTLSAPLTAGTSERGPAELPTQCDALEPLERLEARICELGGHLTAATCQFLLLIADFDERQGWADWEMASCAAWVSWKCQIAPGTAREHVRSPGPWRSTRSSVRSSRRADCRTPRRGR